MASKTKTVIEKVDQQIKNRRVIGITLSILAILLFILVLTNVAKPFNVPILIVGWGLLIISIIMTALNDKANDRRIELEKRIKTK